MTREEYDRRGERLDAAMQAARDAAPKSCPACGSTAIAPMFLWPPDQSWECLDCLIVWNQDDGR